MNYAAAEVSSLMKVVVAEKASTIFIFYVALCTDDDPEAANCPHRMQTKCHQTKHKKLGSNQARLLHCGGQLFESHSLASKQDVRYLIV